MVTESSVKRPISCPPLNLSDPSTCGGIAGASSPGTAKFSAGRRSSGSRNWSRRRGQSVLEAEDSESKGAYLRHKLLVWAAPCQWRAEGERMDAGVSATNVRHGHSRRPRFGWESLTEAELRVVGLAAEGLTNRQVAERLFVSRRTVATHLEHVFQKLGISTRARLAAETVRRLG
jgi:DNA-binding CsgD family transcriptional regulator